MEASSAWPRSRFGLGRAGLRARGSERGGGRAARWRAHAPGRAARGQRGGHDSRVDGRDHRAAAGVRARGARDRSLRRGPAAVHGLRRRHRRARGRALRRPQGAPARAPGEPTHPRVPHAPVRLVSRLGLRGGARERHARARGARGQGLRRRSARRSAVPDSEERPRGDLEPRPALARRPRRAGRRQRRGDHHRRVRGRAERAADRASLRRAGARRLRPAVPQHPARAAQHGVLAVAPGRQCEPRDRGSTRPAPRA
jgi:hypothetical protein